MLVLTRKPGEKIRIGNNIVLTILEVMGNRVRVGIEAPEELDIVRDELISKATLASPTPGIGKPLALTMDLLPTN